MVAALRRRLGGDDAGLAQLGLLLAPQDLVPLQQNQVLQPVPPQVAGGGSAGSEQGGGGLVRAGQRAGAPYSL